MPRDYKHRVKGTLRSPRRRRNQWLLLLPALLIGVAAIAVLKFSGTEDPSSEPGPAIETAGPETAAESKEPALASADAKAKSPAKEQAPSRDGKKKKPASTEKVPVVDLPEPRFTFYKILPEKEVFVSESEIRSLARDEQAGKREPSASYLIQTGSFKTLEEAEKMKARLSAAKVKAKMEKVMIENATWYRVKVGPYTSLTDAEKMRAYLRKNKVDSVLQQTKP